MKLKEMLNEHQIDSVCYEKGPLLVLAGAGTGKTRVITHRIAYLIKNCGVSPEKIMAVTFTNKASDEMRKRVYELVGRSAEDIWLGTFHSIALKILRIESANAGLKNGFSVMDQDDRLSLIKNILRKLNIDSKKYPPKAYLCMISDFKNSLNYADKIPPISDYHMFSEVFDAYCNNMQFLNMVDFDDMVSLVVRMFRKNKTINEYYQMLFEHVLVDEYQDTNALQFIFLKLLTGTCGNICAVGDDDQSIYGWRGADINNILDFEKHFENTKVIKLTTNYRSHNGILISANNLIRNNQFRKGKDLTAIKEIDGEVLINKFYDEQEEAKWVSSKISKLSSEGVSYKDIAILYRTNAQSRNFEVELNRSKIPYKVIGSIGFYQRKEIKDILSYLRVYDNPFDFQSFIRSMKNPPRGIGETTLERIISYATKNNTDIISSLKENIENFSVKQRSSFDIYLSIFSDLKNISLVSEMIEYIIAKTNYLEYLKQFEEVSTADKRTLNLEELLNSAISMEEKSELSLNDFLSNITLVTVADDKMEDAVNVMTVHSAKGLEFDTVFLTGMEDGLFPLFSSFDEIKMMEEERRLCYVGVTRAKRNLYITHTSSRLSYGKRNYSEPSRFLGELKAHTSVVKDNITTGGSMKNGTKVKHEKFGEGVVVSVTGNGDEAKVDVFFKLFGLKKIQKKFLS